MTGSQDAKRSNAWSSYGKLNSMSASRKAYFEWEDWLMNQEMGRPREMGASAL